MKHTHLYERLSNPHIVKGLMKMIRTSDMDTVHELYNNIKTDANDHFRFDAIHNEYINRVNRENNNL